MMREINPEGIFAQWCRRTGRVVPAELDPDSDLAQLYIQEVIKPILREVIERRGERDHGHA